MFRLKIYYIMLNFLLSIALVTKTVIVNNNNKIVFD